MDAVNATYSQAFRNSHSSFQLFFVRRKGGEMLANDRLGVWAFVQESPMEYTKYFDLESGGVAHSCLLPLDCSPGTERLLCYLCLAELQLHLWEAGRNIFRSLSLNVSRDVLLALLSRSGKDRLNKSLYLELLKEIREM